MSQSLAARVAAAASEFPGPIEVRGSGHLAEQVRSRLGADAARVGETPGTVVETTGDVNAIEEAFASVRDLGTVLLAANAQADARTVDLYCHVHVRGLTVVGVSESGE